MNDNGLKPFVFFRAMFYCFQEVANTFSHPKNHPPKLYISIRYRKGIAFDGPKHMAERKLPAIFIFDLYAALWHAGIRSPR